MIKGFTSIKLDSRYDEKLAMLASLLPQYDLGARLQRIPEDWMRDYQIDLGLIDSKIKSGNSLTIVESFQGMLLVLAATNNVLRHLLFPKMSFEEAVAKGSYFLTILAAKEAFVGLTAEEIAGLVAAGQLDLIYTPELATVVETAGMGADRGWGSKAVKTINASSLSALTLTAMGYPAFKHGSYGNTTKVGSTDVFEQFGVKSAILGGPKKIQSIIDRIGFWFSDAHAVKSLHYLSHLLRVETINHVVGPMTPPVGPNTTLFKVIGVNHFVHPYEVAKAYSLLHKMKVVNLGGVVVVAGVDPAFASGRLNDRDWYGRHAHLDEVSPKTTLIAISTPDIEAELRFLQGSSDFGVNLTTDLIKVENTIPTLMAANAGALRGGYLAEYLAMNVAMGLLAMQPYRIDSLRDFVGDALDAIESGAVMNLLHKYVTATGGKFIEW